MESTASSKAFAASFLSVYSVSPMMILNTGSFVSVSIGSFRSVSLSVCKLSSAVVRDFSLSGNALVVCNSRSFLKLIYLSEPVPNPFSALRKPLSSCQNAVIPCF